VKISHLTLGAAAETAVPLLVLPVFEGDDAPELPALPDALADAVTVGRDDLRGALGKSVTLYRGGVVGPARLLFLGMGARDGLDAERVRRYAGHAVRAAEGMELERLSIFVGGTGLDSESAAQALVEGAKLAAWRFDELRSEEGSGTSDDRPPKVTALTVVTEEGEVEAAERGARVGDAIADGQNLARTLQARPGNVATPSHLAEVASRLGSANSLSVTVFGPDRMREEKMQALLAVAQGSEQEPRLILVEHRGAGDDSSPLVLVGKGLTFDAGGISIKPAKGMEEMKFDMSAGAAVLGAMRAIASLELPVNVVGVVPSSENLINGRALKPGDVIRTRSGKTVEVTNTDAEGRLILSDALDYARTTYHPAAMVDCATLTGAVVIGLGHHASAVLGTDDALVEELREAGERSGERCWPLPLWDEYRKQLESETADLNNVGGRPAGAITAACFLREFVGDVPWAHLDIAGTAYGTEPLPYHRKGGYGVPTRLLVEWVRSRAG